MKSSRTLLLSFTLTAILFACFATFRPTSAGAQVGTMILTNSLDGRTCGQSIQPSCGNGWRGLNTLWPGGGVYFSIPNAITPGSPSLRVTDSNGTLWRVQVRQNSNWPIASGSGDNNCNADYGSGKTGYARILYAGPTQVNISNDFNSNDLSLDSDDSNYPSVSSCTHFWYSRFVQYRLQYWNGSSWVTNRETAAVGVKFGDAGIGFSSPGVVYTYDGSQYQVWGTTNDPNIPKASNGQPTIVSIFATGAERSIPNTCGVYLTVTDSLGAVQRYDTTTYIGASPYFGIQQINFTVPAGIPNNPQYVRVAAEPATSGGCASPGTYYIGLSDLKYWTFQ